MGWDGYTLLKAHLFHMCDDSLPSAAPSFVCAAVLDTKLH